MQTRDAEDAWQGLEPLRRPILGFLSRHCRDANELDDVVQETILRAARSRADVRDSRALHAWAMKIAFHVLADRRRRDKRAGLQGLERAAECEELCVREPHDERAEFVLGPWLLDRDAALALLAGALERLASADRRVLEAYYGENGGRRAAARRLRISGELVKVRLYRARKRLLCSLRVLQAERVFQGRPVRRVRQEQGSTSSPEVGAERQDTRVGVESLRSAPLFEVRV